MKSDKQSDICIDCGKPADVRTTDTKMPFCLPCYRTKHSTRSIESIDYLECDRCKVEYHDVESVAMAKKNRGSWMKLCEEDEVEARGLCGCPNLQCKGELILKRS